MCTKVSDLKTEGAKGVYIRNHWSTTGVQGSGSDSHKIKISFRRKIFDHKNSNSHQHAEKILEEASEKKLENTFLQQQKGSYETTSRLMRTAYAIAKHNRPYIAYPELCELQEANGVKLGQCQHSRQAATAMIDCISNEMKKKLCATIRERSQRMSIMLDESTTVSRKACMVVYVRTVWPLDGEMECFAFPVSLVELESATADAILKSLLASLASNGFDERYLKENLIGACSDGASVMLGKNTGVLTQLKNMFPNIFLWHCMCHRIELAIGDAISSVCQVNHVKSFLDKLYSVFSQSAKAQRELEDCAHSVHSEILKIGRVLDVRWVASSYRSLCAVWKSYAALYEFSKNSDTAKSQKHKSTFAGIQAQLESSQLVHNLAVMLDALEAVSDLSKALQSEKCDLGKAYKTVKRTIRILERQKSGEMGDYYQVYEECEESFKGVPLRSTRAVSINKSAFLQALIDNLNSRLYSNVGQVDGGVDFKDLLEEIDVLDNQRWPSSVESPWLEGETRLKSLCRRVGVGYTGVREAFRNFVDDPVIMPNELKTIKTIIDTLPVTSADCERGFSTMNVICSDLRNCLTVQHINNLMFISLVGPPVGQFKPDPYVKV